MEPDARHISFGAWFADDATERTVALLDAPDPPTAILAANSFMAIGALRALRQRQLRVPEDVALVCFDDIEDAAAINPFLTALAQPAYAMGEAAMQFLHDRIGGAYTGAGRSVVLPSHSLLVRRSCGQAQALAPPATGPAPPTLAARLPAP